MVDLLTATATELIALLRARRLSSRELVDAYLDRIARLNAPWNAVVTLDAERARARADALDRARARGEERGPLHGLPMTIKDAYQTAGLRTVAGARPYADHVPERDAVAVQRLLDAGVVILGKTNVPAYSADVQTFNDVFGFRCSHHS
jgi:amidase